MKIIQNIQKDTKPIVTVLCCLHGDEWFGQKVFNYYLNNPIPKGLKVILANEDAIANDKRFIDSDLNRVFPGDKYGDREEQLAAKLKTEIEETKYLIDIHNTATELKVTPILLNITPGTKKVLNQISSEEIIVMPANQGKSSAIGQVPVGVSLEYSFKYAKQKKALLELINTINNLLNNTSLPHKNRKIFYVEGTISLDTELPSSAKNFQYINQLKIYPFLIGNNSYKNHKGFYATKTKDISI